METSSISHSNWWNAEPRPPTWSIYLAVTAALSLWLVLSISLLLSRIISSALTNEQDSDHFAKWFQPTAWRPVFIGPCISSNVSSETDLSISSCALNFLFVLSNGVTSWILTSAELFSIQCIHYLGDLIFLHYGSQR